MPQISSVRRPLTVFGSGRGAYGGREKANQGGNWQQARHPRKHQVLILYQLACRNNRVWGDCRGLAPDGTVSEVGRRVRIKVDRVALPILWARANFQSDGTKTTSSRFLHTTANSSKTWPWETTT